MVRRILDIGNSKYKLNKNALSEFILEARHQHAASHYMDGESHDPRECQSADESLDLIFREVMQLYNEYASSESLDALIRLKSKLEQVSLRYRSLVLAEEVMTINSCLPYERRVPSGGAAGRDDD